MADKVIVGIDDLTALADAARDNLGETQLYSLNELTDAVSRASALPQDGIEGQVVVMGPDGKPVWDIMPQGNWAENDETSPTYIKNRTHYEKYGMYEVMPESTPAAIENVDGIMVGIYVNSIEANVGQEYTITYNGAEYKCVAVDGATIDAVGYVFGNYGLMTGGTDTGEPFIIMALPTEMAAEMGMGIVVYLLDMATELTLKIETVGNVIHKIDDKYINFKRPNWDAMNDEEGYIANRTHYTEQHGSYELDYTFTIGKDSIDMGDGMIAYKVSNRTISENAMKGISFQCYTSDNPGEYITIDAAGSAGSWDEAYSYKNGSGNEVGVITIYNNKYASMDLDYTIPSNGTYLYSNKYQFILMSVPDVVNKIDNKYLDLTGYVKEPQYIQLHEVEMKDKTDTGVLNVNGYNRLLISLYGVVQQATGKLKMKLYGADNKYITEMTMDDIITETGSINFFITIYFDGDFLVYEMDDARTVKFNTARRYRQNWSKTRKKQFGTIQFYTDGHAFVASNDYIKVYGVKA